VKRADRTKGRTGLTTAEREELARRRKRRIASCGRSATSYRKPRPCPRSTSSEVRLDRGGESRIRGAGLRSRLGRLSERALAQKRPASAHTARDQQLRVAIRTAHAQSLGRYGRASHDDDVGADSARLRQVPSTGEASTTETAPSGQSFFTARDAFLAVNSGLRSRAARRIGRRYSARTCFAGTADPRVPAGQGNRTAVVIAARAAVEPSVAMSTWNRCVVDILPSLVS
jgi:hypothetical protein